MEEEARCVEKTGNGPLLYSRKQTPWIPTTNLLRPTIIQEQFSKEWDFLDYESSPIAGKYSSDKTNIFGIGLLMYQIVTLANDPPTTLTDTPPTIREPFFPSYRLNGRQPKGNTYGPDIRAYRNTYGKKLTELITECLYENP